MYPSLPHPTISLPASYLKKIYLSVSYCLSFMLLFQLFTLWISHGRETIQYLRLCAWSCVGNFVLFSSTYFEMSQIVWSNGFSIGIKKNQNCSSNMIFSAPYWNHFCPSSHCTLQYIESTIPFISATKISYFPKIYENTVHFSF